MSSDWNGADGFVLPRILADYMSLWSDWFETTGVLTLPNNWLAKRAGRQSPSVSLAIEGLQPKEHKSITIHA
jgi:hypothetical protein